MMRYIIVSAMALALVGCDQPMIIDDSRLRVWDGAEVVRLCRSGTAIFRLTNGELRLGGTGGKVAAGMAPKEVCD